MLDLISNALAASLILFLVLSLMDDPPIPPTRVQGTMVIEGSITREFERGKIDALFWLKAPEAEEKYGESILELGNELSYASTSCDTKAEGIPRVMLYESPEEPAHQLAIVQCPSEGAWQMGLLYEDHRDLESGRKEAMARISAWYLHENKNFTARIDTSEIIAPTTSLSFEGGIKITSVYNGGF